jgi:hypothetical protein
MKRPYDIYVYENVSQWCGHEYVMVELLHLYCHWFKSKLLGTQIMRDVTYIVTNIEVVTLLLTFETIPKTE